ncbi:MAG: UDP-glucose 4-epimerase GalE [Candidatus Solibacter sp.]
MRILVTGGAGYIGSHVAKELKRAGHTPVVLDNLCRGHEWAVKWGPLLKLDLGDRDALFSTFRDHAFDAVIHLAAFAYVGESILKPAEYFQNNVVNTRNLLDAMAHARVNKIIFSSSCAIYGDPQFLPINEDHPQSPKSPYGESKRIAEELLSERHQAGQVSWAALRYFNAAGADPDGEIGEVHEPEPHLIPIAIAAALGDIQRLEIYGTDYDTPDGTAIRDFVHVTDLARAHVVALEYLCATGRSRSFNLGTGLGYSVGEVVAAVAKRTQREVPVAFQPRREGDPAVLVADVSRAAAELRWQPRYSSLDAIVESAYGWYVHYRAKTVAASGGVR